MHHRRMYFIHLSAWPKKGISTPQTLLKSLIPFDNNKHDDKTVKHVTQMMLISVDDDIFVSSSLFNNNKCVWTGCTCK